MQSKEIDLEREKDVSRILNPPSELWTNNDNSICFLSTFVVYPFSLIAWI